MYPLQIKGKIVDIENDLLLLGQMESQQTKYSFLSHLPDHTAFKIIEIDMQGLVKDKVISPEIYSQNSKQLNYRAKERQKQVKIDDKYNKKV